MKNTPKTPLILNLLGLATALAVFMILMAQVRYDRHYNRCFADYQKMYRLETNPHGQGFESYIYERNLASFLSSQDNVESVCTFSSLGDLYTLHHSADSQKITAARIYDVDFFPFFGYKCVEGDFAELDSKDEVVIPKSLAEKLFPDGKATDDFLLLEYTRKSYLELGEDTAMRFRVVAVYEDMPENSSVDNSVFLIETPRLEYEVVNINVDSMKAQWPWPEPFEYCHIYTRMENDTLFSRLHLTSEVETPSNVTVATGSYNMRYSAGPGHTKRLRVRASTDSADHASVLVKAKLEKPDPHGEMFVKVKSGADTSGLVEKITANSEYYSQQAERSGAPVVRLVAAKDIHFETDVPQYETPASRFVTNALACVAWGVLLIAFLNFANFAMAEAPLRMRRVNTRKVLGESERSIRLSMTVSYVKLALIAFVIAVGIVALCSLFPKLPMLTQPVSLSGNIGIVLITLLLSIVVGVVVSIYPARMVTAVSPDVALKGSYGFSKTGRRLRTIFIGLQFFLASVILTCTLYVAVQNRYLKQYDMGFQMHNILNFKADVNHSKTNEFVESLQQLTGVRDVTAASNPIMPKGYVIFGRPIKTETGDSAVTAIFNVLQVYPNFMEFFGIKMSDGTSFEKCDLSDKQRYAIFNKKAQEMYHLKPGWFYNMESNVDKTEIVGIAQDFHFRPLYDTIQPISLEVGEFGQLLQFFFVKYDEGADTAALAGDIRRLANDFGNDEELTISTLEKDLEDFYAKETGLSHGMFTLCGIAVLLALMGVAGMLLLEMSYRRPELGIRQIFGSSTGQLLAHANGKYALLCTIAFALSVPVSLLLLHQWLHMFVAHAPITVWIYLLSYVILLVLTALVVTVQTALSLRFEPVEVIHNS